jgi:hypothetical protein
LSPPCLDEARLLNPGEAILESDRDISPACESRLRRGDQLTWWCSDVITKAQHTTVRFSRSLRSVTAHAILLGIALRHAATAPANSTSASTTENVIRHMRIVKAIPEMGISRHPTLFRHSDRFIPIHDEYRTNAP